MLPNYVQDIKKEFKGYNASKLTKDILAGLTVTAVALPLAIAFGVSSGADAASGLVTAIIAGLIISALSGAFYQISGPTGAMAAVLLSIIAQYKLQGVFIATFIAGVLLCIAGILHLGRLTSLIPAPVITGFTSGIAIIIALGQIDNFFGVKSQGDSALSKLLSYSRLGFSPSFTAVCIGLFVILFMVVYPKKWNSMIPGSLVSIILATAGSIIFKLDVPIVGEIPKTIFLDNRLAISSISLGTVKGLIIPTISIAMLCMIESLLCGASAGRMTNVRINSDQELIAQGVGNMLIPFFGGIPATAAIARTSVAIKSGAQTRLTGIFHALGLLLAMFALSPIMSKIPLSALAGVLMVTAWRMNEWSSIKYIFSHKFKGAMLKFLITMAATVVLDLTIAIAIGILLGLLLYIVRSATIDVSIEDVDPSRVGFNHTKSASNWCVVYITGPMFFMTSEILKQKLDEVKDNELVIFSLRGVPLADITTVGILIDFYRQSASMGKRVIFSSIQPSVMSLFNQSGLVEIAGEEAFYHSVDKALLKLLYSE